MNFATFTLSTLALLKAAAGTSAIESAVRKNGVRKNAGPVVKETLLFTAFDNEDVKLGAEQRPEGFRDCKQDCIADQCSSVSSDDNTCKSECKKRCNSNTNYSDFSASFSVPSNDVLLKADRSEDFRDCKQDCIADQCSSVSSDDNTCKTECKKRCNSNTNYSDFSSSFSVPSNDVLLKAEQRPEGFRDCKQDCVADQCSSVSSDDNTCKTKCKKRCNSNTNYSDFSSSFSVPSNDVFALEDGGVVIPGDGDVALASRRNLRKRQI